jgi:ABC-type cobalamin/Fe3+-siderophores transport system ATPase subunit
LNSWLAELSEHYHPAHEPFQPGTLHSARFGLAAKLFSFRPRQVASKGRPSALSVERLTVSRGGRVLFGPPQSEPLTFQLESGCLHILEAPNGWGKTSLLETIAGLNPPNGGHVLVENVVVDRFPVWKRKRIGLGYLPSQHGVFSSVNSEGNRKLAGVPFKVPSDHRPAACLSGGQQKWLAFSIMLQTRGLRVLLADEPLNELDHNHCVEAWNSIHAFVRTGGTVLMAVPRHLSRGLEDRDEF